MGIVAGYKIPRQVMAPPLSATQKRPIVNTTNTTTGGKNDGKRQEFKIGLFKMNLNYYVAYLKDAAI